MYEPIIELYYQQQRAEFEKEVYKQIMSVGVSVDKERLVQALEFDRSQYVNGYEDGKKAGEKETLLRIADSFKDSTDKTETCIKAALGWEDDGCYLDCAECILKHYGIESEEEEGGE